MKTVTAAQMQAIDRKAIEGYGIPGLILMENAGRGIAEHILETHRAGRVTVFAGKGNNGGDGFVVARHLANRGFTVSVLLLADPRLLKPDPAVNYAILGCMKVPCSVVDEKTPPEILKAAAAGADILVDALFGTGLERELGGICRSAVEIMNASGKFVVAADMPSGLHSDSGEVLGCAVKATVTATLGVPKTGLFVGSGPEYAGRICVVDIGLPPAAVSEAFGTGNGKGHDGREK
ncbi:MAG: NAD(P)H-hydrate epimerase [Candidatus Omnitrophota bacterium]|jgi:NAD(P)H-hydrate epimerase